MLPRRAFGGLGEHQLAQLGEQRGRQAQQAVGQQQRRPAPPARACAIAGLDQVSASTRCFSSSGTPTLASLAPTMKRQRRRDAPAVVPQVGKQRVCSVPQSERGAPARQRAAATGRGGRRAAHRDDERMAESTRLCRMLQVETMSQDHKPDPAARRAAQFARRQGTGARGDPDARRLPTPTATSSAAGSWRRWTWPAPCCRRASRKGRMATVAVNQFVFKQPVSVGDMLSLLCRA